MGGSSGREKMRGGPQMRNQARKLRRNLTDAEQIPWRELRRKNLGWRFRRQFPIPPYIADFACIEARLIVEADGGQHALPSDHEKRDRKLLQQGWRVLRFWNNEIFTNREGVLRTIADILALPREQNPLPPLGKG